jgi:hypothetical protein
LATDKQIRYLLHLLQSRGYSTTYMNAKYKGMATSRERQGTVITWLKSRNIAQASALIERLK